MVRQRCRRQEQSAISFTRRSSCSFAGWWELRRPVCRASYSSCDSVLRTTVFAVSPWPMEFEATTRLPSSVRAPVLAKALILFARRWARVDIVKRDLLYRLQYDIRNWQQTAFPNKVL